MVLIHDKIQDMFNRVKKHMLTQNAKAINRHGSCKYRIDGLKCAIGALIPDDKYTTDMDTVGSVCSNIKVQHVLIDVFELVSADSFAIHQFVTAAHDLQVIHDDYPVIKWPRELTKFAVNRGLVDTPIDGDSNDIATIPNG